MQTYPRSLSAALSYPSTAAHEGTSTGGDQDGAAVAGPGVKPAWRSCLHVKRAAEAVRGACGCGSRRLSPRTVKPYARGADRRLAASTPWKSERDVTPLKLAGRPKNPAVRWPEAASLFYRGSPLRLPATSLPSKGKFELGDLCVCTSNLVWPVIARGGRQSPSLPGRDGIASVEAGSRPLPPPLGGRGQRPALLPAEGEGQPLAQNSCIGCYDCGSVVRASGCPSP